MPHLYLIIDICWLPNQYKKLSLGRRAEPPKPNRQPTVLVPPQTPKVCKSPKK